MGLKLIIPGEPVPQARPRFTRTGIAYTLDKCKRYRQEVAEAGKLFMLDNNLKPIEEAICVSLSIYRSVPKGWSKSKHEKAVSGEIRPSSKPDLDNYVKAVLDGLNGIVWTDDNLIVNLLAGKYYSDEPRVELQMEAVF